MTTCPICNSDQTKIVAPFRHQNPIFTNCSRAECLSCGMGFATPMPSDTMLTDYNASYFATAHGGQPTNSTATAFFSGIARLRLAFVKRFLNKYQIAIDRVLELGPGSGFFARHWLEVSPHNTYLAVETDASCHPALQDLGVQLVAVDAHVPVDLVVMSHVLEHVPHPVAFVQHATEGLRPGGVIFIEVPCQDWAHKQLDEPHILFFDKPSMHQLLTDLGFVDIEVSYYGQTIRQLQHTSSLRNKLMAIREKLLSLGFVAPFAKKHVGMEMLTQPLECAMAAPFMAHQESIEPAWWLRAVARSRS